jgi:hypothetical protein
MTGRGRAILSAAASRLSRWPLLATLSGVSLRTWTVLAMIVFAVQGALVAYGGATIEQKANLTAEAVGQGQLIEVSTRQRRISQTSTAAALWTREEVVWREGRALADKASQARKQGQPEEGAWLAMRAHEDFAAARAVKLVRDEVGAKRRSAAAENRDVAIELSNMGFADYVRLPATEQTNPTASHAPDRECGESSAAEPASLWCVTSKELHKLHAQVRSSSLVVALFVLALAFFTASDAISKTKWGWLKRHLFAVALLIGVVTFVVALVSGPEATWLWLLSGLAGTLLLWLGLHYLIAWADRRGWTHSGSQEGTVHSEEVTLFERPALRAPVLGHHIEHRFGALTVILIAATVFLSAVVGWFYSISSTNADATAEKARNWAAEMVVRTARFSAFQSEFARLIADVEERRIRGGLSQQRRQLMKSSKSLQQRHDEEEQRHWTALDNGQSEVLNLPLIKSISTVRYFVDMGNLNVDDDPNFPKRLLWQFPRVLFEVPRVDDKARSALEAFEREDRTRNAWEAFAHWRFDGDESIAWRKIATGLLTCLMIFAIALYLLGQALALALSRSGYVLLAAGGLFVLVGLFVGLGVAYPMVGLTYLANAASAPTDSVLVKHKCPPAYSDSGKGRRNLAAYYYSAGMVLLESRSDRKDLERAETYFDCAIALREEFIFAQLQIAETRRSLNDPDADEGYGTPSVQSKVDFADTRSYLQSVNLDLSADRRDSLAYNMAFEALIDGDEKALEKAEELTRETLDLVKARRLVEHDDTKPMLEMNLGFVQLGRGRFDDGRKAYRAGREDAAKNDPFTAFVKLRTSVLTDLEAMRVLRCPNGKPQAGTRFDCVGLERAIEDVSRIMLAERNDSKQPETAPQISRDDLVVSATANRLAASVHGLNPQVDDLWLVWSRQEEGGRWRTLQRVSSPISAKARRKADGTIDLSPQSFLDAYEGTPNCLATGTYRAELYAHGRQITVRPIEYKTPTMKAVRLHELNLRLCMPSDWNLQRVARVLEDNNFGVVRGVFKPDDDVKGKDRPIAFIFSFYLPRFSDGLSSCLSPERSVKCAKDSLASVDVIAKDQPFFAFDQMPDPLDPHALVYRNWTSHDGVVHAVIVKADSGTREQVRQVLESAEVIYPEGDIEDVVLK